MSSMRKVFWRGAFALAMVPVSLGLVAANAPAPAEPAADWQVELSQAAPRDQVREQELALASRLAEAQLRDLRIAVAIAHGKRQEGGDKAVSTIRIVRERTAPPQG